MCVCCIAGRGADENGTDREEYERCDVREVEEREANTWGMLRGKERKVKGYHHYGCIWKGVTAMIQNQQQQTKRE